MANLIPKRGGLNTPLNTNRFNRGRRKNPFASQNFGIDSSAGGLSQGFQGLNSPQGPLFDLPAFENFGSVDGAKDFSMGEDYASNSSLASTFSSGDVKPNFMTKAGRGIGDFFKNNDMKDIATRSAGDILGLINFSKNKQAINEMPITQPFIGVKPTMEDTTPRDAAAINEIRRQSRAASLGVSSGSTQREGNIRGAIAGQAQSEINKVKTNENLRIDAIGARNAGRGQQANMINSGIVNRQFGDIQQNLFTQQQANVNNRQTLIDGVLGNQFQRQNQDLERERMVMIALREGDRGVLRQIYTDMVSNPDSDPRLLKMVESQINGYS